MQLMVVVRLHMGLDAGPALRQGQSPILKKGPK
jgi:hypothetical protein